MNRLAPPPRPASALAALAQRSNCCRRPTPRPTRCLGSEPRTSAMGHEARTMGHGDQKTEDGGHSTVASVRRRNAQHYPREGEAALINHRDSESPETTAWRLLGALRVVRGCKACSQVAAAEADRLATGASQTLASPNGPAIYQPRASAAPPWVGKQPNLIFKHPLKHLPHDRSAHAPRAAMRRPERRQSRRTPKAGAPSSAPVQCGKPLGLCQASGTLESAVSPHSTNPFVSFVCSCESCGLESAGYWVWASDRTRLCGRA